MATNSSTRSAFRVVGLLVYVLIGGAIFMQIEKETGRNSKSQTLEDFLRRWSNTYNLSQENITNLLKDYDDTRENGAKPTWTFLNSVFYVLQLVTTIGKREIVVNLHQNRLPFLISLGTAGAEIFLTRMSYFIEVRCKLNTFWTFSFDMKVPFQNTDIGPVEQHIPDKLTTFKPP